MISSSSSSLLRHASQAIFNTTRCSRCLSSSTLQYAAPAATSSTSSSPKPPPKSKTPKQPISSCPAGTVLTGLAVLKDQADPVALPDEEYPKWLWTILDGEKSNNLANEPSGLGSDNPGQIDYEREKKRLRAVNKANIKAANYLKTT